VNGQGINDQEVHGDDDDAPYRRRLYEHSGH
jgi:hypothetical protein